MNILYCGDAGMCSGITLSAMSIASHTKEPLKIYILTMSFSYNGRMYEPIREDALSVMQDFVSSKNRNSSVKIFDITDLFCRQIPFKNISTRFTPYSMLRLYADLIQELPDKLLYLDADVLCRADIASFYEQDIDEVEYVGVLDHYGSWIFRRFFHKRTYVNSGVLLLNIKKIRQTGMFQKCRSFCCKNKRFLPDQAALNTCVIHKKIAERKYNEQKKLQKNTVLQHFTTSFRLFPWPKCITVKPWQFEQIHEILGIYAYDELFETYRKCMKKINGGNSVKYEE